MPKNLIIVSDMQFDMAMNRNSRTTTFYQKMQENFSEKGIAFPNIIFWNVSGNSSIPVSFNEQGVCIISGFNPSIIGAIQCEKEMTPISIVHEALSTINPLQE